MPRYIDATAYIKYCEENWIPLNVDAVKAQPTADLVEVVRCADCEYCDEYSMCWWWNDDGGEHVPIDGYCMNGERKKTS